MSLATRALHRSLAVVFAAFVVTGCSPDAGGGGASVDEPPIVTNTSGFDFDTTGTFVVGESPESATFSGGLTRSGKWIIRDGTFGTVVFASPARQVDFDFETVAVAGLGAKFSTGGLFKATCGVGNQDLDDGEAFGGQLFMRGDFSDWGPDPEFAFYNFGNNVYQAEFELAAGAYPYKIAQSEWDIFDRIVAGEDTNPDTLYVTSDPGPGGPNGTLVIPSDGCWNITIDATDLDNVTLILTEVTLDGGGGKTTCGVGNQDLDDGEAFGGQLFMRGGFSDWGPDEEFAFFNFGNNVYQAEFELTAGAYQYKIAQSEWDIFDRIVDGEDTNPGTLYVTSDPGPGGPNGNLVIPSDGCWNITIDATDLDNITLIVTEVELGGGGGKEVCGVGNQGLDDGEAFGGQLFLRGGFSDWGPDEEFAFYNFGNNIYQAEFELAAGAYQYKIAQSEWDIFDRIVAGEDTVPDTLYVTSDPGPGGPNGNLVVPATACWNITLDATDIDNVTLIVTETELGGGGPPAFVGVEVRLFDSSGGEIDTEQFDASGGPLDMMASFTQPGSEPAIGRIEIESVGGVGDILVDNFTWSVNPRDVPGGGTAVDVVYHRPDGDYSETVIIFEGQEYACTPGSLGCVATISALANSTIQFTVENAGVADPTGAFTASLGSAGEDVYAFSGNPEAVSGNVTVAPAENEVLLFYQRDDGNYDGWTVHLFPTGQPDWTNFNPGLCTVSGVDPLLGGYFLIKLPPQPCYDANPPALATFPDELGFIIHRGDEKDPGPDQFIRIAEQGNIVFVVSGVNAVSTAPPNASTVGVNGRAAHWIDAGTVLWRPSADTQTVELAWSVDGSIAPGIGELDGNYETLPLFGTTNPEPDNQRHLSGLPAWAVPEDLAAELARYQLVVIGRDRFGVVVEATYVQIAGLLDDLYAGAAQSVPLGVDWSSGSPTVRVWAPTADPVAGVTLTLYSDSQGTVFDTVEMTLDPASGIWSATGDSGWDRLYYDFTLRVYSYAANQFVVNRVTDPWSVSLSADSQYSQIVNLDDTDLKPAGWDALELPTSAAPEDIVLYELHMRDFSVHDPSVPDGLKGKYGAFALETTAGHDHLQALADAGLTHVHILPAFDIATVKERREDRVELDDPVADLCAANAAAAGLCPTHSSKTIGELLEELTAANPVGEEQQQIVDWLRNLDGFNWGYDPWHFGVPEGSFATDPDGVTRILEFREMVQGLANKGLRTVMDVVYNHTNAGGQAEKSVLDRVVPGYYQRYNENTGAIETSTCCSNTATEFAMMEKLMADTLETFTRDYKVGGFRFDLMGHQPKAAMLRVKDRLEAIDPAVFLYGEGWNFGEVGGNRRFEQATQPNMAGTGIATFTDRIRDAIRGGGPFDSGAAHVSTQGFISGGGYDPNAANRPPTESFISEALLSADQIRATMAGSIKTFAFVDRTGETVTGADVPYGGDPVGYVDDPGEIINYSAAHDNETIWDISQHKHPESTSLADRVRAQNLGVDVILLAQGVPFVHAGQDLMRSKSMDRNSYDSGDWFNKLDLTYQDNNWAKGLPPRQDNQASWPQGVDALSNPNTAATPAEIAFARDHFQEMLQVRKSTILFRLPSAAEINARVAYFNTGPEQVFGLIAQGIDGCTSSTVDQPFGYVMSIINANDEAQSQDFGGEFAGQSFELHPVLTTSVDPVVQAASFDGTTGTFSVPARTTAVFVRGEQFSCTPFGVEVFVRGLNGDWSDGPQNLLPYTEGTTYQAVYELTDVNQSFKVASSDWATVNCGSNGSPAVPDEPYALACPSETNISLTVPTTGRYQFTVEADDPANPVLTITKAPPYAVDVFVRGFNGDWSDAPANKLEFVGDDQYRVVLNLSDASDAGNRTFKVASSDWSTVDCGRTGDLVVQPGEPYALTCGPGTSDVDINTSTNGLYAFLLDASDPANPVVTVEKTPYDVTVFVRGLNQDWAETAPMSYTGGGLYEAMLSLDGLEAADRSFKVASSDWSTVNCGAGDPTILPGIPYGLNCASDSTDITLDTDQTGMYHFEVDANQPATPTLTVTGP